MAIRVLLVDDHKVVRQGLAMFFKPVADLQLLGEAANGQDALRLCDEHQPDVVLLDMGLPDMTGVEVTRQIREKHPRTQVIILTSSTDNDMVVKEAMQAGALGYYFKDAEIEELVQAIRNVHAGKPTLAPEATRMLIRAATQPAENDYHLTDRELEVLKVMIEGLNNREIADRLVISYSTVKFHVSSILSKLNVESRTEAVALALQHKLVT